MVAYMVRHWNYFLFLIFAFSFSFVENELISWFFFYFFNSTNIQFSKYQLKIINRKLNANQIKLSGTWIYLFHNKEKKIYGINPKIDSISCSGHYNGCKSRSRNPTKYYHFLFLVIAFVEIFSILIFSFFSSCSLR